MKKAIGVLYNPMRVDRSSAVAFAKTLNIDAGAVVATQNDPKALAIEVIYKPESEPSLFDRIFR